MSIETAVLGYLSWRPLTGYDLKRLFAQSPLFHWSGNSNQIYRALVQLHKRAWVSQETEQQESLPPRKVYSITDAGRHALRARLVEHPELPAVRHPFLVQLAWADLLTTEELQTLLDGYRHEVQMGLILLQEQVRRGLDRPERSERERFLWDQLVQRAAASWQLELDWVEGVQAGLTRLGGE